MKKLLYIVICILVLNACATQNENTMAEGTGLGCLLGAGLGAGIGALIGGGKGAAIGAGAGAAIGCAAGYAYSDNLVDRRKELQGKENNLDAQIQFAKGVSSDTQQYNQMLNTKIARFDQNVTELKKNSANQENIREDLENEKQQIDLELAKTNTGLAEAQKDLDSLKQFQSTQSTQSVELDNQIKELETSLAELEENSRTLASLSQRI